MKSYRHRLFILPKPAFRVIALVASLLVFSGAVSMPATAQNTATFAGLYIGMDAEHLPPNFQPDRFAMNYSGILDGDYIEVTVLDGKIQGIEVTYLGKNSNLDQIYKPMTLGQAISRHSHGLPKEPVLARTVSRKDAPTGLGDIANSIMYYTGGSTSPGTQVQYVYYATPGAPFTRVNKSQLLSKLELSELRKEAPEADTKRRESVAVSSAQQYLKTNTRERALKIIESLADETLGSGRRVDSLIDNAQIWLEVDPSHPDAKQTFCDLRSFKVKFDNNFKSFWIAYTENRSLLNQNDREITVEPVEMRKSLDRRMRQVTAMGYDGTVLCM